VDGTNLAGIVREYACGPQRIPEIVASSLEFGGQAAIDGKDTATEGVVDGDQM